MKKTKTWEELADLYAKRGEIRQTETGFELIDRVTGIIFDLPKEYRVFIDGGVIDPVQFLTLQWHIWEGLFDGKIEPLSVECICGKATLTVGDDDEVEVKFYPADLEADVAQNDTVLVKAHWDMTQGTVDYDWDDWMHQYYDHGIVWSLCKTDDYHSVGDWYWLIQAQPGDMAAFALYMVSMHYTRKLLGVYNVADEAAEEFERNKGSLRRQLKECLSRLPGRVHWIVAAEEMELWPKYDANRELWEKSEYDWQITELEDSFEIRSRGGSPGEIAVERARFDEIGLLKCLAIEDAAKS